MGQAWLERAVRTGNLPKLPNLIILRLIEEAIILSLSFKWPALAVTHSHATQINHSVLHCYTIKCQAGSKTHNSKIL